MKRILIFFEKWLHDEYSQFYPKAVSGFRILYCLLVFLFGRFDFSSISNSPKSLYRPKGSLAVWFDLPGSHFFESLDYIVLICLAFMLFGFKTKWSSILFSMTIIVANSFKYSFGKIDHGMLFLCLVPMVMAFSGWGRYYSVDAKLGDKEEVRKWPISLMSLVIGFGMFTAGIQKLRGGWLNLDFQAIKFHVFKSYLNFREGPLTKLIVSIDSTFFWEFMDYMIVFFEMGFLVAVFHRKVFRGWVIAALFFHVGVFLTMDIAFSNNVPVYLLFLDWVVIMTILKFESLLRVIDKYLNLPVLIAFLMLVLLLKLQLGTPYLNEILELGKEERTVAMFSFPFIVIVISLMTHFFNRKGNTV